MTRWAALALVLVPACAPDSLDVRLVHAEDDDPFEGSDSLVVGLERDGQIIDETVTTFARDGQWTVPSLPYGEGLRIVVETRRGDLVLGRGRSFPFAFLEGTPPRAPVDIYIGTLGVFRRSARGGTRAAAILATEDGAVWVTESGEVHCYRAHGADGRATVERVASHGIRAQWVAVPRRGFIGIAGSDAIVLRRDGSLVGRSAVAALAGHGAGAALVALDDGALVIGGGTALTHLELTPSDEVVATNLNPLPLAVSGSRGTAVRLAAGTRVFALGSDRPGPLVDAFVIDPTGFETTVHLEIVAPPPGSAIGVLAVGLSAIVALVGGRSPAGVEGRVTTLLVTPTDLQILPPIPLELTVARTDARLVEVSTGLLLVIGGVDDAGAAVRRAELIELRGPGDLPGDVVATGELPSDAPAPVGVALADGSVLIVDDGLIAVYTDPRTPSGLP